MTVFPNMEPSFGIDPNCVQNFYPPRSSQRFEGIAFSTSGKILALATADSNAILLFRRQSDGQFDSKPYWTIDGPDSKLAYPHDVAMARLGKYEVLATAQRGGAIILFTQSRFSDSFGLTPVFEISGPQTGLSFSDGTAFVPPSNDYLAACNLQRGVISFFKRTSLWPLAFELTPAFELNHPSLMSPDGIAFSTCGTWLASANHANHSVSIFRRQRAFSVSSDLYCREPIAVLQDPSLCHPHSVAFTPQSNHLLVTNAGENYFCVYAPRGGAHKRTWSDAPVSKQSICSHSEFKQVNAINKMEGGPKGIAIHRQSIAVCSPEQGVKIYSYRVGQQRSRTAA